MLGALMVLGVIWAVVEDIEDPPARLEPNDLYYGLSTIAQSAAALAALLGAFGLWKLDRLQEHDRQEEDRAGQIKQELLRDRVEKPSMESWHQLRLTIIESRRLFFAEERRGLLRALVAFLLGTLTILVLAIVGLAFVDTLRAWGGTVRMGMILASLGLGLGPAVVVWDAARTPPLSWIMWRDVSRLEAQAKETPP
jgi:hypothetical protein